MAALVLLATGTICSLALLVHPWFDINNDGSMYVLTARSIAADYTYSYLGMPFVMRPPGFSMMIAPFTPAGGADFESLNLFLGLVGAAGVILLFVYLRPSLGAAIAALTGAAVWLNPGFQTLRGQVMSDVPGLALLLLCLLVERWATRSPSARSEITLGACIAAAAYVRSVNVLLMPALVLSRLLDLRTRNPECTWKSFLLRRVALFSTTAVVLLAPWSIRDHQSAAPPPADQTRSYTYATAMLHADLGDPDSPRLSIGDILLRAPPRLLRIADALGGRLEMTRDLRALSRKTDPRRVAIGACIIACLLALGVLRRRPAEFFALATILLVAIYFDYTQRLLFPAYILGFAAAVEILHRSLVHAGGPRVGAIAVPTLLLLLIWVDLDPHRYWNRIELRHRRFGELTSELRSELTADARLAAGFGANYSVYLGSPIYSLIFAVNRANDPAAAEHIIDKYELNTVLLTPHEPIDTTLVPYFREHYGEPSRVGAAMLWRVRSGGDASTRDERTPLSDLMTDR